MKDKIRKTIIAALFVTVASRFSIHLDFMIPGFIISMSIVLLAIFIYTFEDLPAIYIAVVTGLIAPGTRVLLDYMSNPVLAAADVAFFFTYGAVYTFTYRYIVRKPRDTRNFLIVIMFCDFFGNLAELSARSFLIPGYKIDMDALFMVIAVAVLRSFMIQIICLAIESYSRFLVSEEHDEEYKRLLSQASVIEAELYLMEKNTTEIEEIMREAYDLNRALGKENLPDDLRQTSLEIARSAHEIKGDYMNIINTLKGSFVSSYDSTRLTIRDIAALEKKNAETFSRVHKLRVTFISEISSSIRVRRPFHMMSIIRNLLTNAAESFIEKKKGTVWLICEERNREDGGKDLMIRVRDNGSGMEQDVKENIFINEFSTKFDENTGNIQRGLGLTLVRDYVEQDYKGSIEVLSQPGEGTEFILRMPLEEVEDQA